MNKRFGIYLKRCTHQRCSTKVVFLKILKNSQENTRVGLSCYKVAGLRPATFFKKRLQKGVFLWIWPNLSEQPFYRTSPGGCCCMKKACYLNDPSNRLLKIRAVKTIWNTRKQWMINRHNIIAQMKQPVFLMLLTSGNRMSRSRYTHIIFAIIRIIGEL